MPSISLPQTSHSRGLIAMLFCVCAAGATFGLTIPLLSILLKDMGASYSVVGLNTAMAPLACIICGLFIPAWLKHFSARRLIMVGIVIIALTMVALSSTRSISLWFGLRFVLGIGIGLVWIVSETWINAIASDENRGKIMGLYGTLFATGFASGPIFLAFVGTQGQLPFAAAITLIVAAAIPLAWAQDGSDELFDDGEEEQAGGLLQLLKNNPNLMIAAIVAGLIEAAIHAHFALYGRDNGLNLEEAILLLSVFEAGSILMQIPLGWLADRIAPMKLLMMCALFASLGSLVVPAAFETAYLMWPLMFLWGGVMMGMYTLALIEIGGRFKGGQLAAASAAYIIMHSVGYLCGPIAAGGAMDLFPPQGLIVTIGAFCFLCFGFIAVRGSSRA